VRLAPDGPDVDIGSMGIPLDEDMEAFVADAKVEAAEAISKLRGDRKRDRVAVAEAVRLAVRRCGQRWSGKKPVVQVLLREG
jgi:ribonuclease J